MKKHLEIPTYRGGIDILVHESTALQHRAGLAADLIERFGSVASIPDGEDSGGRQRLRLQTPDELVSRCCAIADAAFGEFEKRGWLLEVPAPTAPNPREA